jgi:hypothetical protein
MAKTSTPAIETVPVVALRHIEYDQRRIEIGETFEPRAADLAQLLDVLAVQVVERLDPPVQG